MLPPSPNTLTSIIRHGGETDTRTLRRVARVLDVDLAELLMSPEQRLILQTHRERTVERITASVLDQIRDTVHELVRSELAKAGVSTDLTDTPDAAEHLPAPERSRMPEPDPTDRERTDVTRALQLSRIGRAMVVGRRSSSSARASPTAART